MGTDIEWRWADPSGQQRRVRTDELRAALASGVIAPNTPVWRPGWKQWRPAHDVPEFTTSALAAAQGLVPNIPPPPLAVVAVQAQFEAEAGDDFSAAVASEPPPPPAYVPAPIPPSTGQQRPSVAPPSVSKSVKPPAASAAASPAIPAAAAVPAVPAAPASSSRDAGAKANDGARSELGKSLPTAFGVPALDAAGHAMPLSPVTTPFPATAAVKPADTHGPKGKQLGLKAGKASTLVIHGAPPQADAAGNGPAPPINVPAPAGAPPPAAVSPSRPPGAEVEVEELSGSAIIPDDVSDAKFVAPGGVHKQTIMGVQAPAAPMPQPEAPPAQDPPAPPLPDDTEPFASQTNELGDEAGMPRGLKQILHDMRKLQPKNRFVLPVAGGVGALGLLILVGLLARACTKKDDDLVTKKPIPSASASALGTVVPARSVEIPPPPPITQPTSTPRGGSCKVDGSPKVLAPRVVPASGIEIVLHGSSIGIGFATTPKEALAVEVDPGSLEIAQTAKAQSPDPIKRVVPIHSGGKLAALAETEKRPKRTVWTDSPIDVGIVKGSLVASSYGQTTYTRLFQVEGSEPGLDALRGVAIDAKPVGKGYAITFRRGGAVWMGAFTAEPMSPKGQLLRVAGMGPQVGAPTIAASGDVVLVAWADRAAPTDNWGIRWVRFTPGELAPAPKDFTTPSGGLGASAMAPVLVGLDGGRFLLVWTEGPATNHQVRALTIASDGSAIEDPLTISPEGVNAGQAQAGVLPDGRGAVAYLGVKGRTFELAAVPIRCN